MKCNNCGFESEQEFEYCANCGTKVEKQDYFPAESVSLNPAADIVLPALKDKLFLALCILMTATCVLSLAASGMPLLNILITVFLWLTYADAQKGFANEKHLQFISGAVYAQYVIVNVVSIILIVCGVLFGALFDMVTGESEFMTELSLQLENYGMSLETIPQVFINVLGWFLGGLVIFVGVIALVFNILMMKRIHRFAKSVYMGVMYQNTDFESPRTVRNWFIFIAVCSGITVLGSIAAGPLVLISNVCTLAITIMVIILLDKYFLKQN
ncbi:MAG: zinc ribbon domain-containing protein [Ruminococcaceae bacterium]|nr:zinc ribbon domain-containing protein [Oscillospiraceae bacterium]